MKTESGRIRVLAADDYPLVRAGIAARLATKPDLELVAEVRDGAEATERFEALRPDVVPMDLQMSQLGGIAAMRAIDPDARIIALSTFDDDAGVHGALSAGALAYPLKDAGSEQLVGAIRSAAAGQRVVPATAALKLAEFAPRADVTARELRVLQHALQGLGNKEIGAAIGRSAETVEGHLESVLTKLGARDRAHTVTIAIQRGYIHFGD